MKTNATPQLLTIGINDEGKRIDRILRVLLPDYPLSRVYSLIRQGKVTLNGKRIKPNQRVKTGDVIAVPPYVTAKVPGFPTTAAPLYNLPILHEDSDFLVLNKPRGVTSHGEHSFLPQILHHLMATLPPSLTYTPGPLHRLDRNTTGILVFGKSLQGARAFSQSLQLQVIEKYYLSILTGMLTHPVQWKHELHRDREKKITRSIQNFPSNTLPSITTVFPLEVSSAAGGLTLVLIRIQTGKPHQIRAQASTEGYPLLGDVKYGGPPNKGGYFLHSYRLKLADRLDLTAPIPEVFRDKIQGAFGEGPFTYDNLSIL